MQSTGSAVNAKVVVDGLDAYLFYFDLLTNPELDQATRKNYKYRATLHFESLVQTLGDSPRLVDSLGRSSATEYLRELRAAMCSDLLPGQDKIDSLRRWQQLIGGVDQESGDNSANIASAPNLFCGDMPSNQDVIDLVVKLDAAKGSGTSNIAVAREFTKETVSDCPKAKSLLAIIRRLKRDGRVNL